MTTGEVLTRQVQEVLPDRKGLQALMAKKKIRLYLGVDPTGSNLHLGHAVALKKLQQFAQLGHEAILVVGTGTVLAGDPSQRAAARPRITPAEIKENIATWKKQAATFVDFSCVSLRKNGEWLGKLRLPDLLDIAAHVSASQLFQRDMFQARLRRGDTVWTHELLYPLLQGYDSVALDVDLEIGGTDQLFNMLVGRELQRKMRGREKYVLTTPMLPGLDGKPMSKTSGNTVNILDAPVDMYGKLMSMRDELVPRYAELCGDLSLATLRKLPARDAKARLARAITVSCHGEKAAEKAELEFERVFRGGETPAAMEKVALAKNPMPLAELLVAAGLASSKSEARRLVAQGGVKINHKPQADADREIQTQAGTVIQVGKRRFREVAEQKNPARL